MPGDSCDKGPSVGGSVRVVKTLLALKNKYPERVHLLIGNRDANKMNLTSALAPAELASFDGEGPFWVPEAKRVSPLKRAREDDDDASVDQLEPEKKRRPRATSKPLPPPSEDDWNCPICLEVPRGRIHIKCSRGCIFCAECLEQAAAVGDKCAMCREPFGRTRASAHPIRNFPAERAIQDYRARFPGWG